MYTCNGRCSDDMVLEGLTISLLYIIAQTQHHEERNPQEKGKTDAELKDNRIKRGEEVILVRN